MNSNLIHTAKRGALTCGRAFGMRTRALTTQTLAAAIGRVTGEGSVFVTAYPGTPVWRPPSC